MEAGKRAIWFEERNKKIPDKVILWEYLRQMEVWQRQGKPKNRWELRGKSCTRKGGISVRGGEKNSVRNVSRKGDARNCKKGRNRMVSLQCEIRENKNSMTAKASESQIE